MTDYRYKKDGKLYDWADILDSDSESDDDSDECVVDGFRDIDNMNVE
jgi:hypothetical protein